MKVWLSFFWLSGVMLLPLHSSAVLPDRKLPWPTTSSRVLKTMGADARSRFTSKDLSERERFLQSMELRSEGSRPNGVPFLIWSNTNPNLAPRNIEPNAALFEAQTWIEKIAPSLSIRSSDLELEHVTTLDGFLTLTYRQMASGTPVDGGALMITFKNGSLSVIQNQLVAHSVNFESINPISIHAAETIALSEARSRDSSSSLRSPSTYEVWSAGDDAALAVPAIRINVRMNSPKADLAFHLDAIDGHVLAVDDELRHANGEGRIRLLVDSQTVGGTPVPFVARNMKLASGKSLDGDGEVLETTATQTTYDGNYVRLVEESGTPLERLNVQLQGAFRNVDLTPQNRTQADPFVHVNVIRSFVKELVPTIAWQDQLLSVHVNINDVCNAYWDGNVGTLNFFRAGAAPNGETCNNTGQIASVVYHEYGHGLHQQLTSRLDGAVGEGSGDFLAASAINDPIIGKNIVTTEGSYVRRLDEPKAYPADFVGEVHDDGLIWGSALWDLRLALVQKYGARVGQRTSSLLFLRALTQGPNLGTAYSSLLTADDDDNDRTNGTPNSCEINRVFNAHGLIQSSNGQINHTAAGTLPYVALTHQTPGRIPYVASGILLAVNGTNKSTCGTFSMANATLHYALGREGGTWQTLAMTDRGNGNADATVPGVPDGSDLRYYFELTAAGRTFRSGHLDDPHRAVVGGAQQLFREDFETGFGNFSHGTVNSDQVDDWEVSTPKSTALDPERAFSGSQVVGTDLGGGLSGSDGIAKGGRRTFLESTPISTVGYQSLRLEFWQHHAVSGSLRALVNGAEIGTLSDDGTHPTETYRFVSFPVPQTANNQAEIVVRFEADTLQANRGGGWTLDDIRVVGKALEAVVPPTPDNPTPTPNEPEPNPGNNDPGSSPADPTPSLSGDGSPNATPSQTTGKAAGDISNQSSLYGSAGCVCLQNESTSPLHATFVLATVLFFSLRRKRMF